MSSFSDQYYKKMYDDYLKPLYETDPVFNVDELLFAMRDTNTINLLINGDTYFKDIGNVAFKSDDKFSSELLASVSLGDYWNLNLSDYTGAKESVNGPDFTALKASPSKEHVNITISRTNAQLSPNSIIDYVASFMGDSEQGVDANSMIKDDKRMDDYMRSFVLSIGKRFFRAAIDKLRSNNNIYDTPEYDFFKRAKYELAFLSDSKMYSAIELTSETTSAVLCDLVKGIIAKNTEWNAKSTTSPENRRYISSRLLYDLQDGNFKGPLYYKLRNDLFNRLRIPVNIFAGDKTTGVNVGMYFKMILADLYLKTCYPVIIYDYIRCMMNMYASAGDFVNLRLALLAKVMFTYHMLRKLSSYYEQQDNSVVDGKRTAQLSTLYTRLQMYLENVNQLQTTTDGKSVNVIKSYAQELRKASNTVVDENAKIQSLKKEIRANQLSMRNIIYNTQQLRKQYVGKMIQVVVLVSVLLVLIAGCSVLLFLANDTNNFSTYVLYIAGTVAIIVLMFISVLLVVNLLATGKKSS